MNIDRYLNHFDVRFKKPNYFPWPAGGDSSQGHLGDGEGGLDGGGRRTPAGARGPAEERLLRGTLTRSVEGSCHLLPLINPLSRTWCHVTRAHQPHTQINKYTQEHSNTHT